LADYANVLQFKCRDSFGCNLHDFQCNVVAPNPVAITPVTQQQRPAQRQVLREPIGRKYVSNGSAAGLRRFNLDAVDLPVESAGHTADQVRDFPAMSASSQPAGCEKLSRATSQDASPSSGAISMPGGWRLCWQSASFVTRPRLFGN
jgi:hypothetical protein